MRLTAWAAVLLVVACAQTYWDCSPPYDVCPPDGLVMVLGPVLAPNMTLKYPDPRLQLPTLWKSKADFALSAWFRATCSDSCASATSARLEWNVLSPALATTVLLSYKFDASLGQITVDFKYASCAARATLPGTLAYWTMLSASLQTTFDGRVTINIWANTTSLLTSPSLSCDSSPITATISAALYSQSSDAVASVFNLRVFDAAISAATVASLSRMVPDSDANPSFVPGGNWRFYVGANSSLRSSQDCNADSGRLLAIGPVLAAANATLGDSRGPVSLSYVWASMRVNVEDAPAFTSETFIPIFSISSTSGPSLMIWGVRRPADGTARFALLAAVATDGSSVCPQKQIVTVTDETSISTASTQPWRSVSVSISRTVLTVDASLKSVTLPNVFDFEPAAFWSSPYIPPDTSCKYNMVDPDASRIQLADVRFKNDSSLPITSSFSASAVAALYSTAYCTIGSNSDSAQFPPAPCSGHGIADHTKQSCACARTRLGPGCRSCVDGAFAVASFAGDRNGTCSCPSGTDLQASGCVRCAPGFVNARIDGVCAGCAAGKYAPVLDATNCSACPAGTFSPEAQSSCTPCAAGLFSVAQSASCSSCRSGNVPTADGSVCQECAPGRFANVTRCLPCAPGTASDVVNASACLPCNPGTFANSSALLHCSPCASGTISSVPGSTSCSTCPYGTFASSNGSSSCAQCALGSVASTDRSGCSPCDVGQYAWSDTCLECPAGSVSRKGSTTCEACAAGFYANITCRSCPEGSVSAEASTSCTKCANGTSADPRRSTCVACPAGSYSLNGHDCAPCPAGSFADTNTSTDCIPCASGHVAESGATACSLCGVGTGSASDRSICVSCEAGWYSDAGVCDACPAGRYSAKKGAAGCVMCPVGRYSNATARSTECVPCSLTSFTGSEGAMRCDSCQAHSYVSDPSAAVSKRFCLCDAGYFHNLTANADGFLCDSCPDGFQCGASGTTEPLRVGAGYYVDVAADPYTTYKCDPASACLASAGDTTLCEALYTGFRCSSCIFGVSYRLHQQCLACGANIVGIVLMAFASVAFCAAFLAFARPSKTPLSAIGLCLSNIQLIAVFATSLTSHWTPEIQALWQVFSILNFNIELFRADCAVPMGFWTKQYVKLLLPVMACCLLVVLSVCYFACRRVAGGRTSPASLVNRTIFASTLVFLYGHTLLVSTAADPFSCKDAGRGQLFLKRDPSVSCTSEEYKRNIVSSYAALAAYGVGIPLGFSLLLWDRYRTRTLFTDSFLIRYGELISPYHDGFFWWEIVNMVRRLLIILTINLVGGKLAQLFLLLAVLFLTLLLHSFFNPYKTDEENRLATLWNLVTVLVLFSAAVLDSGDSDSGPNESERKTLTLMVFIGLSATVAYTLRCLLLELRARKTALFALIEKRLKKSKMKTDRASGAITPDFVANNLLPGIALTTSPQALASAPQ